MADDVKWIRFKVGTFDGVSFKRIKRAKIDGVVNLRDKLTAVWFELLDLGGKVNNQGLLVNNELAFKSYEDIAIVLDRTTEEVEMCIKWFINESMMDITDDILMISNWNKYQNVEGLDKIRLQNAERQKKFRESKKQLALEYKDNVDSNVTVTLRNAKPLIDNNSISSSSSQPSSLNENNSNEKQDVYKVDTQKRFTPPTLDQVKDYCKERNNSVDAIKWFNFYEAKGWMVGKNKMKDWKAAVRTWEESKPKVEVKHANPNRL